MSERALTASEEEDLKHRRRVDYWLAPRRRRPAAWDAFEASYGDARASLGPRPRPDLRAIEGGRP